MKTPLVIIACAGCAFLGLLTGALLTWELAEKRWGTPAQILGWQFDTFSGIAFDMKARTPATPEEVHERALSMLSSSLLSAGSVYEHVDEATRRRLLIVASNPEVRAISAETDVAARCVTEHAQRRVVECLQDALPLPAGTPRAMAPVHPSVAAPNDPFD